MCCPQVVYTRRKRESACFNGLEHEKKVVEHTCACTKADYECDIWYQRVMSNTETVYSNGLNCEWAGKVSLQCE